MSENIRQDMLEEWSRQDLSEPLAMPIYALLEEMLQLMLNIESEAPAAMGNRQAYLGDVHTTIRAAYESILQATFRRAMAGHAERRATARIVVPRRPLPVTKIPREN